MCDSRSFRCDNLDDEKTPDIVRLLRSNRAQSFDVLNVCVSEGVQRLQTQSQRCGGTLWPIERVGRVANNEHRRYLHIPIAKILDELHLSHMAHLLKFDYFRHNATTRKGLRVHESIVSAYMDYRLGSVPLQMCVGARVTLYIHTSDAYRKRWTFELKRLRNLVFEPKNSTKKKLHDFDQQLEFLSQEAATAERYYCEQLRRFHNKSNSVFTREILQTCLSEVREVIEAINCIEHAQIS